MSEKQFYQNYTADDNLSDLSYELYKLIIELHPMHVFELGCGTGKNLKAFHAEGIVTCGLDISAMNIIKANVRNDLPFVIIGNESNLGHLANFDVAFTCSVLDHIEEVEQVIGELQRMAKTVFLAETQTLVGQFYFAHPYHIYGFNKIEGFSWIGEDGAEYEIWKWQRE